MTNLLFSRAAPALHDEPIDTGGCAVSGCRAEATHKAPKSRDELNSYVWFCLEHVREYNASWDYYAGMNENQIEAHRRHVEAQGRSIGREERWVGLPEESAIALADRLAASGTSPSRHLLREELRRRVRAALDRLKEQDREILALRHLEGLSPAEAAAVLDVTERAAKARHIRALARIRALLEDEAGGTAS